MIDDITIIIYDILHLEGAMWGNIFPDGTATGLAKYIINDVVDVASLENFCAYYVHRKIVCSR